MDKEIKLKDKILFKIYGVWFFRKSAPLLLVEIVIFFIAFYFFFRNVFLEKVIYNAFEAAMGSPVKFAFYFIESFFRSNFLTQVLTFTIFLVSLLFLRDVNRSIVAYATMKRKAIFEKMGLNP